jgi:hypothetical protein
VGGKKERSPAPNSSVGSCSSESTRACGPQVICPPLAFLLLCLPDPLSCITCCVCLCEGLSISPGEHQKETRCQDKKNTHKKCCNVSSIATLFG